MPIWRLAIAAAIPPATPSAAARRFVARQRAAIAASGALAATLILGWAAPVPPSLGWMPAGLGGVLGLGILAWHVARLTAMPVAEPLSAALAAVLVAVALLPALATQALLVPAILSLWGIWRRSGQRIVALLVQCGALAAMPAAAVNQLGFTFVSETMLAIAALLALRNVLQATNDNPCMERTGTNSRLMANPCYASGTQNSESGSGEYGNV